MYREVPLNEHPHSEHTTNSSGSVVLNALGPSNKLKAWSPGSISDGPTPPLLASVSGSGRIVSLVFVCSRRFSMPPGFETGFKVEMAEETSSLPMCASETLFLLIKVEYSGGDLLQ